MIEKVQLKGGIYEPCSDRPLNWRDMRSEFGYTEVISNYGLDISGNRI